MNATRRALAACLLTLIAAPAAHAAERPGVVQRTGRALDRAARRTGGALERAGTWTAERARRVGRWIGGQG